MRVLMVDAAGFSPPYDYALAAALRGRGIEVGMVEPRETGALWGDPDALPTAPRHRWRTLNRIGKGVRHVLRMRQLLTRVRTERPDIVHFQWLPLPAIDRVLLGQLQGTVPLVFTMHNTSLFHGAASSGVQGWNATSSCASFDRIVVHSRYGRDSALRAARATERQLVCIPHGAFAHYAELCPPERADRAGPFTFVFAGSIKPYKGLDVLLRAFSALVSRRPSLDVRLIIAGSPGQDMTPLRDAADQSAGGPRIEWRLRHQCERELAQLLARAHAIVLPYREIDQSGVLLAAVAMHRAVIASGIGGFPEVVRDGENGLLVRPGDVNALSCALERLADDGGLRLQFESSMRALSLGALSWDTVAAQTASMYRALLSS
jgi:glycosyltransferase involved in cell wall biosynthesis